MSLNFDLTNCRKDLRELYPDAEDGGRSYVTTGLIFATMSVGLGEIKESNVGEFFARLHTFELMHGALVYRPQDSTLPKYITEEEVIDHIGLRTNVSDETRTKWMNRIVKAQMQSFAYDAETTLKRSKVAAFQEG